MQETKVICNEVPIHMFNYDPSDMTFSQEVSTLEGNGHFCFKQVWNDACDVGFTMVGKTGHKVIFTLGNEIRYGSDYEVGGWEFEAYRKNDSIPAFKVVIFND